MSYHLMSPEMGPFNDEPTTRVRVSDQDELKVWVTGEGSPVVFSHGVFWPDLLVPLMAELAKQGAS